MHTERQPAITEISYTYLYHDTPIPYTIWSSVETTDEVKAVIFLGTVQVDNLARWVAESCPPNTIVVQGAPHWMAKSDGSDIPEYMLSFTKSVFDTLVEDFTITTCHIMAESQAVPGVLGLFSQKEYLSYPQKLTLLQPLGLNASAYSGTSEQRIEIFRRRIAANLSHQLRALLTDKRLRHNHRTMSKIVGTSLRSPKARAQYSSGLQHDAIAHLKALNDASIDIAIICGANDKLFPPIEIETSLAANRIAVPVQIITGVPHSPLASRYGQKLLKAAFKVD